MRKSRTKLGRKTRHVRPGCGESPRPANGGERCAEPCLCKAPDLPLQVRFAPGQEPPSEATETEAPDPNASERKETES